MTPLRVRFASGLVSAGSLCAVGAGLAALDDRVRSFMANVLTSDPSSDLALASTYFQQLKRTLIEATGTQSIEHAPIAVFAFAGMVLVLLMLRK